MDQTLKVKRGIFDWYFKTSLLLRIFIGMVLGAVAGWWAGDSILWVQPFGDILLRLLSMIVMPIIFASLVVGAASISPKALGRVGIKLLAFFAMTTVFAITLGLVIANLFRPGEGLGLVDADGGGQAARELTAPSLLETLLNVIPRNPFAAIAEGQVLPVIFFAVLFGLAICFLREHGEERIEKAGELLFTFFEGMAEAMYVIVRWVLQYAPIGVFALIAVVFARQGAEALGPLGMVTAACYSGFVLQVVCIYGGLLVLNKLGFWKYLNGSKEAIVTGFVTRSSSATLPVMMKAADEMGVDKSVYSFTLPLGATINMDGTAIYHGVCALFIGFAIGMPLDLGQQITVILTATLASIGTAGVPAAGAIMLLIVLNSVGLPVEPGTAVAAAYAMVLGVDAVLDMGRTGVNVAGNLCATALIGKSEKKLDRSKWEHPHDHFDTSEAPPQTKQDML